MSGSSWWGIARDLVSLGVELIAEAARAKLRRPRAHRKAELDAAAKAELRSKQEAELRERDAAYYK